MVKLNPIRMQSWDSSNIGKWLKNSLENPSIVTVDQDSLTYPQLLCQFIGVSMDEDEYFTILHTQLNDSDGKLINLTNSLNKNIAPDKLRAINQLFEIHRQEKGLSPNRMVAFLEGHFLLPKLNDPDLNRRIRIVLIDLLKQLQSNYVEGTQHHEYRRKIGRAHV